MWLDVGTNTLPARWPHWMAFSRAFNQNNDGNLLPTMQLIFEMNCRGTLKMSQESLCKEMSLTDSAKSFTNFITEDRPPCLSNCLIERHRNKRRKAPCIGISNDWSEIVYIFHFGPLLWCSSHPFVVMLLVMQLLSTENTVDLIWNSRVWIVTWKVTSYAIAVRILTQDQDPLRYCKWSARWM